VLNAIHVPQEKHMRKFKQQLLLARPFVQLVLYPPIAKNIMQQQSQEALLQLATSVNMVTKRL
jgi:hypothetical protein